MIRPRLIPLLLLENENLIKTISFKNPTYLGDPINALKIFNEKEVDEICILDKSARINGINFKLLENLANEAFMPLSYGGGVKTIEDAKRIIKIGFEKIILNEITFESMDFVKKLSAEIGNQSVVVSIDYRVDLFGRHICFYRGGQFNGNISPLKHAIESVKNGAGEILITSIDHEGKMKGFDYSLIQKLSKLVDVPLIAHGGCGSLADIKKVIYENGAAAVAIGSFFVFYGKKKGILINYPTQELLFNEGIYI